MSDNELVREVFKRKRGRSQMEEDAVEEEREDLFRLTSVEGGKTYSFGRDGVNIGRDPGSCGIVITDNNVSRVHCALSVLQSEVCIHDKSFNGTFVNGRKIGRGRFALLSDGDVISVVNPNVNKEIGAFSFTFTGQINKRGTAPLDRQALMGPLDFYELGPIIGQGSFSVVRMGAHRVGGGRVAVKVIEKRKIAYDLVREAVKVEMQITQHLEHRHVVKTLNIIDSADFVAIVMEYISGGDLFDYIVGRGKGPFSEEEAKYLFSQIVDAFLYLKRKGIVHGDVKPENILVSFDDPSTSASEIPMAATEGHQETAKTISPRSVTLKLSDFGSARYEGDVILLDADNSIVMGTPTYGAPELFCSGDTPSASQPSITLDSSTDVWSLGILLYVLCTGALPKRSGCEVLLTSQLFTFSEDCKDLLSCMLRVDPTQRVTMEGIARHSWLEPYELGGTFKDEDSLAATMSLASPLAVRSNRPSFGPPK
ncbi:Inner membrane component of T3SS, cytoplasmic domain/FHA domain/Protein kinase domain/Protein tyrosine kinase, putative [Angomonas deanei]|uniref:Inner membrane component of T3SS, cytoplasmic domain/FHA domain/Protein kinase domain/Protein tyrosine kinase, putative n=1 Tax=Angomonas deanei TaxID=59799 RepID=A0A7G2CJJ6_9TRYP|nr:Inner membrane component of T3SS, cytoplasmic domain/FHA domain/Protein kinase domain/Protein tyrosine kinase, putative [Angomonas deanei]